MCDGIENIINIQGVKYDGIKVRSNVAEKLNLEYEKISYNVDSEILEVHYDNALEKNDFNINSYFDLNLSNNMFSYISDIHLLHRFMMNSCISSNDTIYITRKIVRDILTPLCKINLIGGDITSDVSVYKNFINYYKQINYSKKTFITLGNHELWDFEDVTFDSIVNEYKKIINDSNMFLVQNNLYVVSYNKIREITENRLNELSLLDLRAETRDASLIIFGGIGFAGKNEKFNANNGIYRKTISREKEIELSNEFYNLYKKVSKALYDKNVIILTHMPVTDWAGQEDYVKGFVYVNGHTHNNYFCDDDIRIYADNQVGYKNKDVHLKYFYIDNCFDWFSDYKDGIYEIDRHNYKQFYLGLGENIVFERKFKKLYMLKKLNTYVFLLANTTGNLMILNGGAIKKAENSSIEYYFNNMDNYSKSIKMHLCEYEKWQKEISKLVKLIGGSGHIHGCIIDIDFYSHLFLNPIDKTITSYFANSITEKYVYNNFTSLLKDKCPQIYLNYKKYRISYKDEFIKFNELSLKTTRNVIYVEDTSIYKISRIIKNLQFTSKHNVIRVWNDNILSTCSDENGKKIISEILLSENSNTNV